MRLFADGSSLAASGKNIDELYQKVLIAETLLWY